MTDVLLAHGPRAAQLHRPGLLYADNYVSLWGADTQCLAVNADYLAVVAGCSRPHPKDVLANVHRWASQPDNTNWHGLVALLDRHSGRLVVHRERIGITHLYHARFSNTLLVGTDPDEVATTVATLGGPTGFDHEAVAAYLTFQYVPAPRTIRRGIRQLLPGSTLIVDRAAEPIVRRPVTWPAGTADGDTDANQVIALVTASLRDQLNLNQPVAALVSGGVDTSTVVTVLVEELGIKPTCFTAAFAQPEFDETPYARAVTEHLGLAHEVHIITPQAESTVDELAAALRIPHGDRALLAEHVLFRAIREANFTQVVTGEGGDELLGSPRIRDGQENLPKLPDQPRDLAAWYLERTCLAHHDTRESLLLPLGVDPHLGVSILAEHYAAMVTSDPFERLLYGQWLTWLPDGVLVKDAEVARWHQLRPVIPFASAELAGHIAALKPNAKRRWLKDKGLLRPYMARSLPRSVLTKPKHKFWLPIADWFRGPWRDLLHDTLTDPNASIIADLDAHALRRLLTEHAAGTDHSRLLWGLLVLARWADTHAQRKVR